MLGQFCSTDDVAVICDGSRLPTLRARVGRGAARGDRAWVRRRTGAIPTLRPTCQGGCCETVIRRGGAAMAHRGAGRRRHGSEIDRWPVARHCFGRPAPFLPSGLDPFGPTMSRTRGPGATPSHQFGRRGQVPLARRCAGSGRPWQCIDHGRRLARFGFPEGRTARLNASSIKGCRFLVGGCLVS